MLFVHNLLSARVHARARGRVNMCKHKAVAKDTKMRRITMLFPSFTATSKTGSANVICVPSMAKKE